MELPSHALEGMEKDILLAWLSYDAGDMGSFRTMSAALEPDFEEMSAVYRDALAEIKDLVETEAVNQDQVVGSSLEAEED